MASDDVKLVIGADGSGAIQVAQDITNAYKTLSATSIAEINKKKAEVIAAYERIKTSGIASAQEISRADVAKNKQLADLNRELTGHGTLVERIKSHWLGFTVAIAGAAMVLNKAWNLAEMAADYEEQMNMLNRFAATYNTTATAIVDDIKQITKGQIAMADIAKISSKALALNVPLDKYKELAKYADAVGDALGVNTTEALTMLTEAAEKGTEKSMKMLVGVVDLDAKYGKLTATMTDQDKIGARVGIMLENLKTKYGETGASVDSTADKMERMTAMVKDMQLHLGTGLIRAALGAAGAFQWLAAGALGAAGAILRGGQAMAWLIMQVDKSDAAKAAFESIKAEADAMFGAAEELTGKAADNFQAMTASSEDFAKAMAKTQSPLEKLKVDIDATTKALQEQSQALNKSGADMLKFSGETFSEGLKTQVDTIKSAQEAYTKLSGAGDRYFANLELQKISTEGMTKSLTGYLKIIDSVYAKQLEGQKTIRMKMEIEGADPKAMAQQSMVILETEKAQAMARLGAWSQYYETLKGLHSQAIDAQKQKSLELLELEKQIRDQRLGYADLKLGLEQKLMTESQKYNSTQQSLEEKYRAAMALTGAEKIAALNQYSQLAAGAANAVIQDGKTVVSLQEAVNTALRQTANAQREIVAEQERLKQAKQAEIDQLKVWVADLSAAMATAQAAMELYKNQIIDLGNTIGSMSLAIYVDNQQALSAVNEVKASIDAIPDVTYKKIIMEVVTKASPEQPFTQGMEYIADKLGSLPTGSKYTMDFSSVTSSIKMMSDMQLQMASLQSQAKIFGGYGADVSGLIAQAEVLNRSSLMLEQAIRMMMDEGREKGSYASGTAYVPETGRYKLHQGEMVLNRQQAAGYDKQRSNMSISLGGITVNGADKDPEQLAREIVKPLQKEMRRLAAYN